MDSLFGIDDGKRSRSFEESPSISRRVQNDVYRVVTSTRRPRPKHHHGSENEISDIPESTTVGIDGLTDYSTHEPTPGRPFEFKGCEPPMTSVSRRVDVDRPSWEFFCKKSLGRARSGVFTNFFQTGEVDEKWHSPSIEVPQHRSVLRLPVLSPYSRAYQNWSSMVTAVDATYTAFLVPIIVAFVGRSGDVITNITSIIELSFGCIFLADILMNLHVGFMIHYEYKRKIVMDGKFILWYYIKHGGAWIDFLSVAPLFYETCEIIVNGFGSQNDQVTALRLFRLLRLYRLLKQMYGSSFSGSHARLIFNITAPAGVVYLLSVVYTMLVMMNLLGCFLFYIAYLEDERLDGTWVQKYISATEDVDTNEEALDYISHQTSPELYLTSLYWAVTTVTTVGYGDITPDSYMEMIVLIFVMLSHIMMFGLLIGSISELVKSSLRTLQFQEENKKKVDTIAKWMKYRNLGHSTIQKINAYYMESQKASQDFDEDAILRDLPLSLRTDVVYKLTKVLMSELQVFVDIDQSTLKKLAGRLDPLKLAPGHELVRQGDLADALYILEEGTISVIFNEAELYNINSPETCAEIGILSSFIPQLKHHPVTLRTVTSCSLWKLSNKDSATVCALDPKLKSSITEGYRMRLLRSLNATHLGRDLERQIEAEFGCRISTLHAKKFRSELERVSTGDGTFRRLVEEIMSDHLQEDDSAHIERFQKTSNFYDQTQLVNGNGQSSQGHHHHHLREPSKVLEQLISFIHEQGEFGMIDWVLKHRAKLLGGGHVDLKGLQDLVELKPRALLQLFCQYDQSETGRINIESLIDDLRLFSNFENREKVIEVLFVRLCRVQENDKGVILTLKRLMQVYCPRNHPQVQSGMKSTSAALNQLILYFPVEDVQLEGFLNFHKDLSLCIIDDEYFFSLVSSLWSTNY